MNITLHPDGQQAARKAAAGIALNGQKPQAGIDMQNIQGGVRWTDGAGNQNQVNGKNIQGGLTFPGTGQAGQNGINNYKPNSGHQYNPTPNGNSNSSGGYGNYGPRQYNYNGAGQVGVRQALNSMGIDDGRIGYRNGKVTVDGLEFTPASIEDGRAYADENDLYSFANNVFRGQGDELVRISDYVSGRGLPIQPKYENGRVYLGGQEVPYAYIQDGRAYVPKSALDGIYKNLAQQAAVKAQDEAYQYWQNQYQNRLDNKLSDIENSKFQYNLESDPAYRAYRDQYTREGERAYRQAAAQMVAANGGNMTSMAQSAANQQLNYYMQQLGDRVPELQQNAYNRFDADRNARIQAYDRYMNLGDSDYNRRQYANELARQQYIEGYNELKGRDAEARAAAAERLANMSEANSLAQQVGGYTPYTREVAGVPEDWDAYAGTQKQNDMEVDKQNRMVSHQLSEQNKYTLEQMAAEYGYNVDLQNMKYMNERDIAELNSLLDERRQISLAREESKLSMKEYKEKDQYDWNNTINRFQTQSEMDGRMLEIDAAIKTYLEQYSLDAEYYDTAKRSENNLLTSKPYGARSNASTTGRINEDG